MTTHLMTYLDENTPVRNHLGTTRCGVDVFANLDDAPTGPKLARSATTPDRKRSTCKRCNATYDARHPTHR
jgi:hypothetical protein